MTASLQSDPFVAAAIRANQELYRTLRHPDASRYRALQQGAGGDITHGIDQLAEDIFVRHLQGFGEIHSEESGRIGSGSKRIYLDPLDGSDNFLSNFPYYGTSVALEGAEGVESGIIANLATGTIYVRHGGLLGVSGLEGIAFRPMVPNPSPKVGIFERGYRSFDGANRLKKAKIKYRIPGAVALSLALAPEVSFVLIEGALRDFDVKAGLYMCADMYQHSAKDLTIICQEEKMFDQLRQILLEKR